MKRDTPASFWANGLVVASLDILPLVLRIYNLIYYNKYTLTIKFFIDLNNDIYIYKIVDII